MAGKLYRLDPRLHKAYGDGYRAHDMGDNPHKPQTPEWSAFRYGFLAHKEDMHPDHPDHPEKQPTMANLKSEIIDYLLLAGWHQQDLDGKTKAELLELVAAPPLEEMPL